MPFCSVCRYEYVEGVAKCPDCGAKLVDVLPEEPPDSEERPVPAELVTIATFMTPVEAEMARVRLESQGIQSVIADEIIGRTDFPLVFGGVKVRVRAEDARRASP